MPHREAGREGPGAREREQRAGVLAEVVDERLERTHLGLVRDRRVVDIAVGETRAEPVVPHYAMPGGELLDEGADVRLLPVELEVAQPPRRQDEQRPLADRRVSEPASVHGAEADLLLHAKRVVARPWA